MKIRTDQFPSINLNPVLSVEKDGTVIYSNEAGEPLLHEWGVRVGEKLPVSIGDLVQRATSQNSPINIEVNVGKKVYLISFYHFLEDECVNIYGFDISELKEFKEEVQESETRFRALAENFPDIITRFDRQYRHVYANHAAVKSYDIPLDEIIGKTQGELRRTPKTVKLWEEFLENSFVTGKTEVLEYQYISPQGKKYYFYTKIVPEFAYGKITSVLAISRDITDIKETENKLKETLDNLENSVKERTAELENANKSLKESEQSLAEAQKMAHIGNWDWNLISGEMHWSDEMYHIFGYLPQESGSSYDVILSRTHPDDREYVDNAVKRSFKGAPFDIDHRIVLTDGTERVVNAQGEVIFDEKSIPVQMKGTVQDITERKKSEVVIRNLANIVESSNDAIGTISPKGIIISWNKGAEQIYGYSAEEILGKSISVLAPSHLGDETEKLGERVRQGESIHQYETLRLRKDGKLIDVSITLSPVFDAHGKLIAISFISRDISEKKAVEEKLRKSEEKYRNIVETTNEGISLNNSEGIITYLNQKMAKMLGCSITEVIGRNMLDFVETADESIVTKNTQNKSPDTIESYYFKLICKDGFPLWVSINSKHIFDEHGKFIGSLNMYTDITERKEAEEKLRESEEKYRNIVETANEGVVRTDNKSVITYVNKKMLDMLGYTLEEVVGRTICCFISDEYKPIIKMNLEKKKQGISESGELKLIHKDGSYLWIHMNSKPLFDKEGKYLGAVSMLTDINKRKEAEQALANFEIAREKEIHHRIKNNLQVVYSMLDFNAFKFKGRKDIKDSEVIDSIRESKNRVRSIALIHEELYKSSESKTINFSTYVEKLANNLLSIYRLGNTDINLNKDMDEDLFFDMDTAIPLGTMINETVSNSLKYAFRGRDKGEIQIKMHREENRESIRDITENSKSTTFVLTVSDNGIGIPENLNIEELDSLGLQLITNLVNQLGGELELKRRNGTEFIIRFTVIEKDNKAQKAAYGNLWNNTCKK